MTKKLTTAFGAESELRNDIPNANASTGQASYANGFGAETMKPLTDGGIAPDGKDFNGIFYDITGNIVDINKGLAIQKYDDSYSTAIGGYPNNARLVLDDGKTLVISTLDNNSNNPNSNMTGWTLVTDAMMQTWTGVTQQAENKLFVTSCYDVEALKNIAVAQDRNCFVTSQANRGLFKYEANSITAENGFTVVASNVGGGRWVRQFSEASYDNWINPLDFGVIPDGTTDNKSALNTMFSYINSIGGGAVYFPSGKYGMVGGVQLPDDGNILVVCSPNAHFIRLSGSTMIRCKMDLVNGSYTGYGYGGQNFKWFGGIIDTNPQVAGVNSCFGLQAVLNFTIEDATMIVGRGGHAIDLNSSKDVRINNNQFYCQKSDISANNKEAIQIAEGRYSGGTLGCEDIWVVGNTFKADPNSSDAYAFDSGVGNHNGTHNVYHKRIYIKDNTFIGCNYRGVGLFKHSDSIVSGNTFDGCKYAIMDFASGMQSDASKDQNGVQSNTSQVGYNVKIVNNNIVDCSYGIYCGDAAYTSAGTVAYRDSYIIEGNTMKSTAVGSFGILMLWSTKAKIINNTITNYGIGIETQYSNCTDIIGNTVDAAIVGIRTRETYNSDFNGKDYSREQFIGNNVLLNIQNDGISVLASSKHTITDNVGSAIGISANNTRNLVYFTTPDTVAINNTVRATGNSNKASKVVEAGSGATNAIIRGSSGFGTVNGMPSQSLATGGYIDESGSLGNPESVIKAPYGSRYYDYPTATMYIKKGSGNTGWTAT